MTLLNLPDGWSELAVGDGAVALGPWRSFSFGHDLVLVPNPGGWVPERPDTRGLREENVETLMLFNLDKLFPGYQLALCGKSLRDWAGADIEATDPSGCRHLFEVKYGARADHVIDQALSYALDTVSRAGLEEEHFHQQPAEEQVRFLACRIAGFWTGTRADKWKRNTKLAPEARDWDAMQRVLKAKPGVSIDAVQCRQLATAHLASEAKPPPIPAVLTGVHFHLAIPNPKKVSAEQLYALARLRWRGHRASVWQVAAELEADGGRFALREVWVPASSTAKTRWAISDGAGPSVHRVGELYARVAAADPSLMERLPPPQCGRGESMEMGDQWSGPFPKVRFSVVTDRGNEELRVYAWVINPPSLDDLHGADKAKAIRASRCQTLSEWIVKAAPADDATRDTVLSLKKRPQRWDTQDPATGCALRAWHSGGLKSASVSISLQNPELAASTAARCLRALLNAADARSDGFGPEAVQR